MNPLIEKIVAAVVALGMTWLLLAGASTLRVGSARAADLPAPAGAAAQAPTPAGRRDTVVFAGGCFWGVQGVFQHVRGVDRAVSGYIGGDAASARYDIVSGGRSGHAEAVQVTYDPAVVSYAQLMQVFFAVVHDPTQLNRQGPDHGPQYRSGVWTTTPGQRAATTAYIAQLGRAGAFADPIVTTVAGDAPFYPAEDYHQDYLTLHPDQPYIRYHDLPKVAALKASFPALYRDEPVLVSPR